MLETIHLSHLPATLSLYVGLYHSVQNAPWLRQQLLVSNPDFQYAFIDASMIVSRTHILAACFRALNDYLNGRLKSRNVQSEIVFSLSGNNNILEAFRKFGIQDSTTSLLVIHVPIQSTADGPQTNSTTPSKESVEEHLRSSIQGTAVSFDDETLARTCDLVKVRKEYKVTAAAAAKKSGRHGQAELEVDRTEGNERARLERAILGTMALRGAT